MAEGVVRVTALELPVADMAWDVRSVDVAMADTSAVTQVLSDVAGLRRWLDGVEVACARRLQHLAVDRPSMFPEQIAAAATRQGLRQGARASRRAETADKVPELGEALAGGEVSGEHVDAVSAALSGPTPAQRRVLA
jgi:hypothetical protein